LLTFEKFVQLKLMKSMKNCVSRNIMLLQLTAFILRFQYIPENNKKQAKDCCERVQWITVVTLIE